MKNRLPTTIKLRKVIPTQRQMARITTGRRIREPLPAKKKKEALAKAKNKCQYPGCKVKKGIVKLQFHHINMKNDDNRLSNIKVLCPNHHDVIHRKIKRKIQKDILGREVKSRIVKVKSKNKKRKAKRKRQPSLNILAPSRDWF